MAEINTKQIVQKWKEELKLEVDGLKGKGIFPKLTIIQDSQTQEECAMYKRNKHRVAEELGIESEDFKIDTVGKSKEDILLELMDTFSYDVKNPAIIQLPFTNLTSKDLGDIVPYDIDVDGFSNEQKGKLVSGDDDVLVPCTAQGVIELLKEIYKDDLSSKTMCVVNRSDLIGKPLVQLALQNNITPIVCHSKTGASTLSKSMIGCDIIVTGCGKRKIFDHNSISDKVETIIDCSMFRDTTIDNKVGDFDKESILEHYPNINIASGIGHTGLLTTLFLMKNVIKSYKNML